MSTWLTTIVMNSANTILRRRSRHSLRVVDSLDGKQDNNAVLSTLSDPSPTPEEICRKWELANHIAVVSERLSPTMHRTLNCVTSVVLTLKKLQRALGVTVGTARVYLSRARARIKQELYKSSGRRTHPLIEVDPYTLSLVIEGRMIMS